MKRLLFLLLIMGNLFADEVDKYEQTYQNKLAQFKQEYDERCRKYTIDYLKALKRLQQSIVKTGDLEGALKVKARIDAIKQQINSNQSVVDSNNIDIEETQTTAVIQKVIPIVNQYFYKSAEQLIGTVWQVYSKGKLVPNVTITLLVNGGFRVTNSPGWRSYWKWGYKDGCIIFGASQTRGQKVTFSDDGQKTINHYNISRRETYIQHWELISPKMKYNNRIYHWSSTQRIVFQSNGMALKASKTGAFRYFGKWTEIKPNVIKCGIYTFHFDSSLSSYRIEKGGKIYDTPIRFLGMLK